MLHGLSTWEMSWWNHERHSRPLCDLGLDHSPGWYYLWNTNCRDMWVDTVPIQCCDNVVYKTPNRAQTALSNHHLFALMISS